MATRSPTLPAVPASRPHASSASDRIRDRFRPTRCPLPTSHTSRVLALWALTGALTGLGVLLGLLIPALAPAGTPHPTLHGTASEAASIFAHNMRILAAPLILAAARWETGPTTRLLGDAIVAATMIVSPLLVGAAIGDHGLQLLAYLPQLPLEWAALSVAAGAWISARRARLEIPSLVAYAASVTTLAVIAQPPPADRRTAHRHRRAHRRHRRNVRLPQPHRVRAALGARPDGRRRRLGARRT